jgi:hypothetical protein
VSGSGVSSLFARLLCTLTTMTMTIKQSTQAPMATTIHTQNGTPALL